MTDRDDSKEKLDNNPKEIDDLQFQFTTYLGEDFILSRMGPDLFNKESE